MLGATRMLHSQRQRRGTDAAQLSIDYYTVWCGKNISVKAPDQQQAVRLKTLDEDYTIESLASRILWKDVGSGGTLPRGQPSELSERYIAIIYDVEQLALNGRKAAVKAHNFANHNGIYGRFAFKKRMGQ